MIELNDEAMREAKKSLKVKGIKSEDVKNLPPIEELCKPIPHSSTIEVHYLQHFDDRDIPHSKRPLRVMIFLPRRRRRSIKQLHNLLE
jgi:hypothetical protein